MNDIVKAFQQFTPHPSNELELARESLPPETLKILESVLSQTDEKVYGMPFERLQRTVHDPKLQEKFNADFGITFVEYLQRKASGEMMGTTQVNGKWRSIELASKPHTRA